MTKEYWLKKEKERKSIIQRFMCVWKTTSLILSNQVPFFGKPAKCRTLTNDVKIYTEMHTIDWWWKTQKQLFEHVTIISLFITTNKIVLTQHHDDLATWSMYLTIENLKVEIRRKQTRSNNLLFDFIFIMSFDNHDYIKTDV